MRRYEGVEGERGRPGGRKVAVVMTKGRREVDMADIGR